MPAVRKSPRAPTKREPKTKVRIDPFAELREAVSETKVAEALALNNTDVSSHIVDVISTQSLALDAKIGGGIPCGRVTEMFSEEGVGKSTIAAHAMASVQREGGLAILIDTEETADVLYLGLIGVDTTKLQVIQFKRGEQTIEGVFEVIATIITRHQEKFPDVKVLIVWDSVAATPSAEELKKDIGEAHGAKPARSIKAGLRRITPFLAGTRIALVMINHMYQSIGGYGPGANKKVVYGGKAISYMATLRLKLFPLESIKDKATGAVIGRKIGAEVVKIKNGSNWRQVAEIAILHGIGIDNIYTIHEALLKAGIIHIGGSYYYLHFEGEEPLKWQKGFQGLGPLVTEKPELWGRLVSTYQNLDKPALPDGVTAQD